MKHPEEKYNKNQAKYLEKCSPEQREFHAQLFRIGNATYRYHQLATESEPTEEYYFEWLQGLPENIRKDMKERGFEGCKNILSFTRYVNERNDIGMDEYLKENLSPEDFKAHNLHTSK